MDTCVHVAEFLCYSPEAVMTLLGLCCYRSVAQSCPPLCDPWTAACQASLSLTISWSLPKFMFIVSVMSSSHLILWCPLLLLPSVFPNIRESSNESAVCIRLPKYWHRSFQRVLREINAEYSLEGLMLKLKIQYFGHLMQTADSLKSPWCWERLRAEGEEGIRGWDGWMASTMQWTWTWANFSRWLGTDWPGMLQSRESQRVGTRLGNWTTTIKSTLIT